MIKELTILIKNSDSGQVNEEKKGYHSQKRQVRNQANFVSKIPHQNIFFDYPFRFGLQSTIHSGKVSQHSLMIE